MSDQNTSVLATPAANSTFASEPGKATAVVHEDYFPDFPFKRKSILS